MKIQANIQYLSENAAAAACPQKLQGPSQRSNTYGYCGRIDSTNCLSLSFLPTLLCQRFDNWRSQGVETSLYLNNRIPYFII